MIVYIYNIGVDLYNGFNGLRHRINWTYFTVLDGLAHPLYSANGGTYGKNRSIMQENTVIDILNYVSKISNNIKIVNFFGGEPFLGYKAIIKTCEWFEKNYDELPIFKVVTNFTYLPDELLDVGTLKKKDDKFILENIAYMDVYGDENMVIFTPDKQIKFMKYCLLNDYVPFILHTHLNEEDKTFSLPDKSFLEKFSCTYNKLFSKKIVIGALINVQGRKFQLIYIEEDQEYVSCLMNI